jgi:hypothetical protein
LEIEDMPTYVIEGKKIRTDSALTDDEIDEIAATFKNTAKQKITPQEYDDAWAANVAGLGTGLGDEFLAGVGSVFRSDLGNYDKQLEDIRASQRKLSDYDPAGNIIGQVAGGLPLAMLTGGPADRKSTRLNSSHQCG